VKIISRSYCIVALILGILLTFNSCNRMNMEWTDLSPLPAIAPEIIQPGVAGPFAGIHGSTLIVAGGANFPDAMPWFGGQKKYHSEIYLLRLPANGTTWSVCQRGEGLPRPVAYGASASVRAGLVCMGGETETGMSDEVYIITVTGDKPLITPLPPLPVPLSNAASAASGSMVYIAGGTTPTGASHSLWSLDTEDLGSGWEKLADLPLPLINSVMVALNDEEPVLWMLGGRTRQEGDDMSIIRSEMFSYSIRDDRWQWEGELGDGTGTVTLAAGTGMAVNGRFIALFGGNDGSVFNRVEKILSEMARESDTALLAERRKEYITLQEGHPGFSRDVILVDIEKRRCYKAGEIPGPAQVTTAAVETKWGTVIPSGEIKPGVRTPAVRMARFK
jgi:cyclically-permuted mutarotase family protein